MAGENEPRPPEQPGAPKPGGAGPRPSRSLVSWLLFIGMALVLLVMLHGTGQGVQSITIDEFWTQVENGNVGEIVLREDTITGKFLNVDQGADPEVSLSFELRYPPNAIEHDFIQRVLAKSPDTKVTQEPRSVWVNVLITLLPWLLIFAFIWFILFRQLRNAGGGMGMLGSFGRSRHRVSSKEHTKVTFADVAGVEEAQEEVQEVVEFLKAPKKFQRLGGRIPRGVLLVGAPGCGKTLLAKAIAGEADVPFFCISGSDFVEMFVGVGASRVRDLFKQAKDNSPCIIFLDEIDAVGRKRGASFSGGGGHDEREQTLNAILVEMDGFETSDQVIVIAATNRADVLDQALIRPGRFDRQVYVPLPDVQGRHDILKIHARKVKLGPNVDLRRIARGTSTFSGADLAALINEAALLATMAEREFVEQDDLEEARDKVRWGRAKKSRAIDEKEKTAAAYHEAGHALVQALEKDADPVHKVSIIPRGLQGGATFSLPEKDRDSYSERFVRAMMRVLCAGRIAEEMFCDDVNTGAAADIRQATEVARKMVTEWGMSEKLGFIAYADEARAGFWDFPGNREYSEQTAKLIDEEIRKLVDEAYSDAERVVRENKDRIEAIKEALLKYETLTGEEVNALIRGESLDKPSVGDLLDDAERPAPAVGMARPVPADPDKPTPEPDTGPLPMPG